MSSDLEAENRVLRARLAELEHSNQLDPLMLAVVEHASAFVLVVNLEGRLLATGRESERFGSVVGRSAFEFTAPESHDTMRAAWARAQETGQPVWYEVTGYGEDGAAGRVFRVRAVPLGDPGNVTAILLVPTDITDRVKLERALIESEQALRLAVDATRIGLWRWDILENRVEWDKRLLEIWGLAETPPTYEAYREFIHADDRPRVEAAIGEALKTGHYPTFEHRLKVGGAGEDRHVLALGTVIKNDHGNPVRLMGGVLDITDQKRLEAQFARANRVEAIGQLTAGIAHNFNNLLTVIIPGVELSRDRAIGEEREQLSTALDAALQARAVVKSLLELARQRSDDSEARCSPTATAERAVMICRATFPREIQISSTIDQRVGDVPIGAAELEQVLLNLLFNARDALGDVDRTRRKASVTVDRITEAGSPWVRLAVADNGGGMSGDVRARLFEPFFTTKPPHRGSGLGLANALLRVRQAGGRLDCTTTSAEGSTFEILLPEIAADPIKAAPIPTEPKAARGETILVVDDEPIVRSAVRRLLQAKGYVVLEAAGAAEARAILGGEHGHRVRLVILDHSMPEETGIDALPSLRALSSAPVILFSGMVDEHPPGVAALFEKPARPSELWRLVREVLDR